MRFNARNEYWIPMIIRGVEGYFTDARIDCQTVADGFEFWELADNDSDGIPYRYKKRILVNFYGTFITRGILPIDCIEWQEGFISDAEWEFSNGSSVKYSEIERLELCRMREEKRSFLDTHV